MAANADIQKFSRHRDGHIEYFIKVVHNGREWGIKKRYREFEKLHEHLVRSGFVFDGKLPQKTLWKKNTEDKLIKRRKALQIYLSKLLKTFSMDNSVMKEFFEVETVWLKLARRNSVREMMTQEQLSRLPVLLTSMMVTIPFQRNRSMSYNIKLTPSMPFGSPSARQKSISFSQSIIRGTSSRKESFAGGEAAANNGLQRDRRFSIDIFNLSYSNGSNSVDHLMTASQQTMKRTAFGRAVQALWKHYEEDIMAICHEADSVKPSAFHNINNSSKFRGIATSSSSSNNAIIKALTTTNTSTTTRIDNILNRIHNWETNDIATAPAAAFDITGLIVKEFAPVRGSSNDSKVSHGTNSVDAITVASDCTSVEATSLKG